MIILTEEARRRRRRRANCKYNLRQLSAPVLLSRPCQLCQLNLPPHPIEVFRSENFNWQDWEENLRRESREEESQVSWISPGPKSPDTPGDDSIDELIRSSSDSDSDDSANSVEILSSDTENPPPFRAWRIKAWFKHFVRISQVNNKYVF